MGYDNNLANKDVALSDSQLLQMKFDLVDGALAIVLKFKLVYLPQPKTITITFRKVKEYSFFHKSDSSFCDMEFCKFLYVDNLYFISLDPYDQEDVPHEKDQDYVYAEEAFIVYEN